MRLDEDVPLLELTLALNGKARTIEIGPGRRGRARVTVLRRAPSGRTADELVARVPHVLALDQDLSDFYELVAGDPDLPLASAGVGPYATAQILMLLGRYSRLILDSWSRPKYAQLNGRKASDKTIERRFRRYKQYAGLAFWLYVTRDWVAEPAGIK